MKRFLIAATALLLLAAGIYYARFYGGFYLGLAGDGTLSVPFRTEGTQLQVRSGDSYEPLILRGVTVSASVPGHFSAAFAAGEEDYLRWFQAIGDMGANAVRAVQVMDPDFYNALCAYNTSAARPLYLLQGIGVPDDVSARGADAYDEEFLGSLLHTGREAVDVVHGRRNTSEGRYRRDVSPWVAGYLVGTEWSADTIAYTNHSLLHSGSYEGAYFRTAEGAAPFEAMLARVMDEMTAYETEKYSVQRPAGFLCAPSYDFLRYEEHYARQLKKYACLDPENVLPGANCRAGCFAAYGLEHFCDEFSRCLSAEQRAELGGILSLTDVAQPFGGYLDLLSRRHTMPVIAAGYAASSARGISVLEQTPLSEEAQGMELADVSRTIEADGWAGGFISSWQDAWDQRTWNASFGTSAESACLWHDVQDVGQNCGLMAFSPGEEAVCVLDGDSSEWTEEDVVREEGGLRLSARYDAEYLFLLLEGAEADETVCIPLDISPEAGSQTCASPALRFQREADFLLRLDGPEGGQLLVHERFDAVRERFLYEIEGQDPFADVPARDSGRFVPVRMALDDRQLTEPAAGAVQAPRRMGTCETGRLACGSAAEHGALADFCRDGNCVEIRLPWQLLNVGDPPSMAVHGDHYAHYGVELQRVSAFWLGVTTAAGEGETAMSPFRVEGWKQTAYRERLKDSYFVMQSLWKGQGKDGAAVN